MKILALTNGIMSEGRSGGDDHINAVCGEWGKKHDVTFILPSFAKEHLPHHTVSTCGYQTGKPTTLFELLKTFAWRTFKIRSLALHHEADLVISSAGLFDIIAGLAHKRKFRSRLVVYAFHVASHRMAGIGKAFMITQCLAIGLMRKADLVFCCNYDVQDTLLAYGLGRNQVAVQLPAVKIQAIYNAQPKGDYDVLFIGRLVRRKGVFDLIKVVTGMGIKTGIVGTGPAQPELEKLIFKNKLQEQVDLLGNLKDEDMYSLLKGCKCFLFPSYEEGYGIVIAEAIIAKKAILTYWQSHYYSMFGSSLVTVLMGDVFALKHKLKMILSEPEKYVSKYKHIKIYSAEQAAKEEMSRIKDG